MVLAPSIHGFNRVSSRERAGGSVVVLASGSLPARARSSGLMRVSHASKVSKKRPPHLWSGVGENPHLKKKSFLTCFWIYTGIFESYFKSNIKFPMQVTVSKDDTVILDGAGDKKSIEERLEQVCVLLLMCCDLLYTSTFWF
jgi:hypothetical protein